MTNLFVVGNETNLADLATTLLRSRTSATARESALAALRGANPSLDFDRIQPGTVVLVPPEVGAKTAVAGDDPLHRAGADLVDRVRTGIDALVTAAEAAEEQRGADQKSTQELLGSALVKRLSAQSPELAANVESVRATLKGDDAEAKRQQAGIQEAARAWAGDLDELTNLLLP